VLLVAWAWFVSGFLVEPSAIGRTRLVLYLVIGGGLGAAGAGLVSALGLLTHRRWSWALGVIASAVMIGTVIGAVTGIPALAGLWSSRKN
jgi:hypothetical protein